MNLMNSPVTLTIFNTGQSCLWSTFPLPLLDYFDANLKHHISFVKFYYVSLKPRLLFKSHNYSIIVMPKLKKKSLLSSNIQCLNFLDFVKIMFHIKKKKVLGFYFICTCTLTCNLFIWKLRSTVLSWYISWNRAELCRAPPSTKAPPCLLPLVCGKAGLLGFPVSQKCSVSSN